MSNNWLCYDGGGVRGVLAARVTERLRDAVPGLLIGADGFGGTSTGSILAAALALGLDPAACTKLYCDRAADIFADRDWRDTLSGPMDEYWRANYDRDGLREALEAVFGSSTLGDLPRRVVIPTFYYGYGKRPASVKVWHNFEGAGNDRHVSVVDVVEASSAAPLYFPAKESPDPARYTGTFGDGGLVMNNPCGAVLAKILKMQRLRTTALLSSIRILSISCGSVPLVVPAGDWGARQWVVKGGSPLLRVLFEGQVGATDYLTREVLEALGAKYFRVDVPLPEEVGLDDAAQIQKLLQWADAADLSDAVRWLKSWWVS